MKILRLKEVMDRTGLSRSTLYRLIEQDEFPKQVSLGGRAVGFVDQEIDDWLIEKIAQRDSQSSSKEVA